jgi:hypothetical protein
MNRLSPAHSQTLPPEADERCLLRLALEMQSSATLLTVLLTVARLGCEATHVHASRCHATLEVLAPPHLAHRVRPCLQELIEVLQVAEAGSLPCAII